MTETSGSAAQEAPSRPLPLQGVRVAEFTQMVMGPSCGLILADLGADVVKVEPLPRGDRTRHLPDLACGFFTAFSRNKKSLAVDMKDPRGIEVAKRLIASSDVLIENFKPGMMARFGLDYARIGPENPQLIYCALKGFLPGPYEHRTALDEVVQMMAGLAFMTGPPGQPMRAGASVNDIMGAMFAVIAIQGALRERESTGRGQLVQSALFENCAFLMVQALLYEVISGKPAIPWSVRQSPWPVYDLFDTAGGEKIFLGVIGAEQWRTFCEAFERTDWLEDPRLASHDERCAARPWLIPELGDMLKRFDIGALSETFARLGLPFAPVAKPIDLADDPHLTASGGLVDIALPDGRRAGVPGLPIEMDGRRFGARLEAPALGQDTREVLRGLGLAESEIDALIADGIAQISEEAG